MKLKSIYNDSFHRFCIFLVTLGANVRIAMQYIFKTLTVLILFLCVLNCKAQEKQNNGITIDNQNISLNENHGVLISTDNATTEVIVGAQQFDLYLPLLRNKKVGVVTNQTGILQEKKGGMPIHLVDFLVKNGIDVQTIFAPEHGFRGKADAGELIKDGKDVKTGLPIISLYGKNKKPYPSQLQNLDVIVFDIQDVGVRFYTYISTLHYVMEAAAEQGLPVIVLDRPNPNAHYIDGPIREPQHTSFVGMHPVPIVYGMTIGEYAQMINGEKWLEKNLRCDLTVIPLLNYTHQTRYELPVKPSPNLPNATSINLYPSLCFFEGANVSAGRGTDLQFQIYGSPYLPKKGYSFTPEPNEGAKQPKFQGQLCYGENLSDSPYLNQINLEWLIKAYKENTHSPFFTKNGGTYWIDKLAGTSNLRSQIQKGWSAPEIKATWQEGIAEFKNTRIKYLLYSD